MSNDLYKEKNYDKIIHNTGNTYLKRVVAIQMSMSFLQLIYLYLEDTSINNQQETLSRSPISPSTAVNSSQNKQQNNQQSTNMVTSTPRNKSSNKKVNR